MRIFLFLFFIASYARSQTSCNPPGIKFPVYDQDGLGTCASNSASLLMQYNISGMPAAPSYLQLSIAASAANTNSFFKPDSGDTATSGNLFVNGNNVCNVFNTAAQTGFCDSNLFPLDFIGTSDSFGSQRKSLEFLSGVLSRNQPQMDELRRNLSNPETHDDAIKRLAYSLFKDSQNCKVPPRQIMAKRLWARQRSSWLGKMATLPPPKRAELQSVMAKTFNANGEPNQTAMNFAYEDMFHEDFATKLYADEKDKKRSGGEISGIYNENVFGVHWGYHLKLESPNFLSNSGSDPSDIRNDWQAMSACTGPSAPRALGLYLSNPTCELPTSPLPQEMMNFAASMARELAAPNYDPQAAIISIIAPQCAAQARTRRIDNYKCTLMDTRGDAKSIAARELAQKELCGGRALSFSVCSDFMEASTPTYSNYCAGKTAFHAFTAIDVRRAEGGKVQYLIQNSWGKSCKFADGIYQKPAFNGLVQCEIGSDSVQ
jgi:hypothetical protein